MSGILFWDPVCNHSYDSYSVHSQATGGAEGSVSRVADALGAYVVQHNRVEDNGRYRTPGKLPDITHVVVLRDARAIAPLRRLYPEASISLWLHDQILPGSTRARRLGQSARVLRDCRVTIICVSNWQCGGVKTILRRLGIANQVSTRTIYNPVDESLAASTAEVDADKLVFFSSPNKGLAFSLDAFRAVRAHLPALRLVVGNPGYKRGNPGPMPGVTFAGAQPPSVIHAQVKTALCNFCPNFVIPETFGLVFAESMALGTPSLTHDIGAAREVIGDEAQLLPVPASLRVYEGLARMMPSRLRSTCGGWRGRARLFDPYVERIEHWRQGGRPVVHADPRFALAGIAAQWSDLLARLG